MWGVEVTFGQRTLAPAQIRPLAQDGTYSGSVDYLPVTGEVLEVRDGKGNLMWSAMATPSG
jgi:hypothetical protein